MVRKEGEGVNGNIKHKEEFVEKLRRMRKTNQISGKIIIIKKRFCWFLLERSHRMLGKAWLCECVYGVGMSDWFGNHLWEDIKWES